MFSFRLLPQRALSHDGKKHSVTVPVRLRKSQVVEASKHEGKSLNFYQRLVIID